MNRVLKRLTVTVIAICMCMSFVSYAAPSSGADWYATTRVNIRKQPNTESGIAATIDAGQAVTYVERVNDEWSKVKYNGGTYYVASRYFSDKKTGQTATASGDGQLISFNKSWKYAEYSAINSGNAVLYKAKTNRKNITIGVNAGHGTKGGDAVKTYCHPDGSAKVTGGSTSAGAIKATAVSSGMTFNDGTPEPKVTLRQAQILKEILLADGYDVLMLRDGDDVQLDNVARTVMCNNLANCHIALHWDGDGLGYDKGCFYMSVPNGIKNMAPVSSVWQLDNQLGNCLITGLKGRGLKIFGDGYMDIDLTQTSYSSVPSVDIELGNQNSTHTDSDLYERAYGILAGINKFFGKA